MRRTPSGENSTCTPSVAISALYCVVSEASGSVRMRTKSPTFSESSSTRIGNRPCSSGIRSEGLERLNAPEAMNSTWSVFTGPYLVATVEPSTSGSRSRCTPSRETSAPRVSWRRVTLSISSMNTMPFCSALASARILSSSSLMSLPASSSVRSLSASRTLTLRVRVRLPERFWNIDCSCCCISSIPGGAMISTPIGTARISISTSRSSSSCSRSILRNFCRVSESRACAGSSVEKPIMRGFGSSVSSTRSSAASSARSRTLAISCSRVIFTATSASSLTIESTSRPTYPTSVNLVASTLTNGALASLASRRAISVLPTPVGPIMRMFLGVISWRSGSPTCMRGQRVRKAIATARLAASWPMMCLSSSWTICRGVSADMTTLDPHTLRAVQFLDDEVAVGVDADIGGDFERTLGDASRIELRALEQRPRRGQGVLRARTAGGHVVIRLDHIAIARHDEQLVRVTDQQQRLEPSQVAVGAPVLGELDRRTREVGVLLELRLKALEQRERVGRAAGESRQHPIVGEAAYLARVALHDAVTQRYLAVAPQGDGPVAAHAEDGRAVGVKGTVRLRHGK